MAPGGSVGRRSTISYDAKAAQAVSTPPVLDPARYVFAKDYTLNKHSYNNNYNNM